MRNDFALKLSRCQLLLFLVATTFASQALPYPAWRNPDLHAERSHDPFRVPRALADAVDFWRHVFGVWQRSQVALHDDTHLGVIYEVLDLPGVVGEMRTDEQRAFVEARRKRLASSLRDLAFRARHGVPLDGEHRRLLALIDKGAGRDALFSASERLRAQRGMRERFLEGLQTSGRYDAAIREVFQIAGLPQDLAYLPHVESSFMNHAHSSAGAVGIWQFTAPAGRRFLEMNAAVDERYDPVLAARGAARYLAHAYAELGDWGLAVTSYNHGIGGMARAKREYGADIERIVRHYRGPVFGFSSRNFYAEFLAVRTLLADLKTYFPQGVQFDRALDYARVRLKRDVALRGLADVYRVERDLLVEINPAWTSKAVRGHIGLPAGTDVWLPRDIALARSAYAYTYALPIGSASSLPLAATGAHPIGDLALSSIPDRDRSPSLARPGMAESTGFIRVAKRSTEFSNRTNDELSNSRNPKTMVWRRRSRYKTPVHVVRSGESPHRIAMQYGVSVPKLLKLNSLKRGSVIRPGQRLRVGAR